VGIAPSRTTKRMSLPTRDFVTCPCWRPQPDTAYSLAVAAAGRGGGVDSTSEQAERPSTDGTDTLEAR